MELFKLLGTIAIGGVDEAKKGMDGVADKAEKSSGKMGKAVGAVGKAVGTMGKIAGAAVAAGTAAAGALTKTAVESFAEYEQLVGGSKLLYGDAYAFVEEKAKNAFQNVQMSQNAYLEQMNGFATGLKTALGGDAQAAAELADKILTAEADIVAATGNSQEAVQNAFNGIMKSNFTMLDNLQLGITPTKEGFQEVIDKVNEWNAANGEATDYQIENLADCQAALVQYVEMQGLAGYAAREASQTIQGSAATMKSAWQNVLVGLVDSNQDMDGLLEKLGDSVLTFADNIIPKIEQTLTGIGTMIEKIVPPIVEKLPELIVRVLPGLVSAGASIVSALTQALISGLPQLLQLGSDMLSQLLTGLSQNFDSIMTTAIEFISMLLGSLSEAVIVNLPLLLQLGVDLIVNILNGITQNIGKMLDTALEIVLTLADGILSAIPELLPAAADAIVEFCLALTDPGLLMSLLDAALEIIVVLADGLLSAIPQLLDAVPLILENLVSFIMMGLPKIIEVGIELILALGLGLLDAIPQLIECVPVILSAVASGIFGYDWFGLGRKLLGKLGSGVLNAMASFVKIFDKIMTSAKDTVAKGVQGLIDLFDFDWKLPEIKLPHFTINGKFSVNPPSVPKFGIEWYEKGGVMTDPTIFGINGSNLMVGGEKKPEAIAPIDVLQGYVAEAVASQNAGMVDALEKILFAIIAMDENMGGHLKKALEGTSFEVNNREFARLVKAVN